MARKATEFPAQWVQMSDFVWTKDMSKKNRSIAKQYIDWILADVEKRDRAILDMWEQLTKMKIDVNRKLQDVRDRKDYEIWMLKKRNAELQALYDKEKWRDTTSICVAIIASLIAIIEFILLLF